MRILGFIVGCIVTVSGFGLLLRPAVMDMQFLTEPALESKVSADSDIRPGEHQAGKTELETEVTDSRVPSDLPADQPEEAAEELLIPASEDPEGKRERHLFWSPFRSRLAASGFSSSLTGSSGVSVEVVELSPTEFRVAFEYQDETERLTMIERIESTTGLKLTEAGRP